jgi:hypothetical protein
MPTRVSALVVHNRLFCPSFLVCYAPEADILEGKGGKILPPTPLSIKKMMKYLDTPDLQCCFSFCLYLQEKDAE